MNKKTGLSLFALCFALIMSAAVARFSHSQEVFSVPISDELVSGDLFLPNGTMVSFGAREGTMVVIRERSHSPAIAFIPQIISVSESRVKIRAYEIVEHEERAKISQLVKETRDIFVDDEEKSFQTGYGPFRIRISGAAQVEFPNMELVDPRVTHPYELTRLYGVSGGGSCCVTCWGVSVCASEISARCGSCSGGGRRVKSEG